MRRKAPARAAGQAAGGRGGRRGGQGSTTVERPGHEGTAAPLPARVGLAAIAAAVVLVGALDLHEASEFTLLRRTISQHGLGPHAWVFALAMVLLGCGSAAVTVAVVRRRLGRALSAEVLALHCWSAGLVVVGLVPKHNWAVGPSMSGYVHRYAGLVAFVCLPIAALVISARWWRHPLSRWPARCVALFGGLAVLWMTGIGVVIVQAVQDDLPWWRAMPLGAVERVLALIEVATVIALGVWTAGRGPRTRPAAAASAPSAPATSPPTASRTASTSGPGSAREPATEPATAPRAGRPSGAATGTPPASGADPTPAPTRGTSADDPPPDRMPARR